MDAIGATLRHHILMPSVHAGGLTRVVALIAVATATQSCNCNPPPRISPVQRSDKTINTCKEILLEINEADFYRHLAKRASRRNLTQFYAPACMLFGPLTASTAEDSAYERLNYLGTIYKFKNCSEEKKQKELQEKKKKAAKAQRPAAPPVYPIPQGARPVQIMPQQNGAAPYYVPYPSPYYYPNPVITAPPQRSPK